MAEEIFYGYFILDFFVRKADCFPVNVLAICLSSFVNPVSRLGAGLPVGYRETLVQGHSQLG